MKVGRIDVEVLESEFERTTSELEMSTEQLTARHGVSSRAAELEQPSSGSARWRVMSRKKLIVATKAKD